MVKPSASSHGFSQLQGFPGIPWAPRSRGGNMTPRNEVEEKFTLREHLTWKVREILILPQYPPVITYNNWTYPVYMKPSVNWEVVN